MVLMELLAIIRNLLSGEQYQRLELSGDLLVEYQPPVVHDPRHTLRIARRKHLPGDHELVSIRLRLLAAGRILGQPVDEESWSFNRYAERMGRDVPWHGYEIHWQTARPQWVQGALL